jgi:quercetin dioxygenase-like cupin family protein
VALPSVIDRQDKLLTLNTNDLPILRDSVAPGVDVQPLFLDPQNGVWVLRTIFAPGVTLPNHFHTGSVHGFTLSGKWYYTQYPDQPQTAGSYLYEPAGSIHQFRTPADNTEPTVALFVVSGANLNFDDNNNFHSVMDAGMIVKMVETLAKAQGHGKARYITNPGNHSTVD